MKNHRAVSRDRTGRLLVECLVATIMLAAAALITVSLSRSAVWSTQTAQATMASWSRANTIAETAMAASCDRVPVLPDFQSPRVSVSVTEQAGPVLHEQFMTATIIPSPFAGVRPLPLLLHSARVCP